MLKRIVPVVALAAIVLVFGNCVITTRATVHTPPPPRVRTETKVVVSGPPVVVVDDDDPELVVVPGTYVYWLDGHDDVYFYGGFWWRFYGGGWYRATVYNGRWASVQVRVVPRAVTHLPSGWRGRYREAPRVRWYEARDHHRSWERDRHWEKRKWRKAPPPPPPKPAPRRVEPRKPEPRRVQPAPKPLPKKRYRDDPFDD